MGCWCRFNKFSLNKKFESQPAWCTDSPSLLYFSWHGRLLQHKVSTSGCLLLIDVFLWCFNKTRRIRSILYLAIKIAIYIHVLPPCSAWLSGSDCRRQYCKYACLYDMCVPIDMCACLFHIQATGLNSSQFNHFFKLNNLLTWLLIQFYKRYQSDPLKGC